MTSSEHLKMGLGSANKTFASLCKSTPEMASVFLSSVDY